MNAVIETNDLGKQDAAREAVAAWVRPHLFTPLHQSLPITTATP
jgi:hypothetical protein